MIMSKQNKHAHSQSIDDRGFTLLEVMIAVAVLAITLTVLYGSQTQSLSLAAEAKFNTTAAFLSNIKLAELESGVLELTDDEGTFEEDYPEYLWKIVVEDMNFSEPEFLENITDLKLVTLTILWDGSPFSHSVYYYHLVRE